MRVRVNLPKSAVSVVKVSPAVASVAVILTKGLTGADRFRLYAVLVVLLLRRTPR